MYLFPHFTGKKYFYCIQVLYLLYLQVYIKIVNETFPYKTFAKVLIFCVEFWELFHLTCDLFQADKKLAVVTS